MLFDDGQKQVEELWGFQPTDNLMKSKEQQNLYGLHIRNAERCPKSSRL